jgi:hypothetical protein
MKTIGIGTPLKSLGLRKMLSALGEVFGIRFEERTFENSVGIDAWFLPEADREVSRHLSRCDRPTYAIIQSNRQVPCGGSSTIEFSRNPMLPNVLAGRRINANEAVSLMALPQVVDNMEVLALKGGAPIWAMQERAGLPHHYVSTSIPELNEGEALFQYFHGNQFLSLLPLWIFLRALTGDPSWERPPIQACFMLDDPNLHWRTYGFVDFAKVATHAQTHGYHISFATIPLDAWFVHQPTALLFRKYRDQLSLLIHGNNHIAQELARPYSEEGLSVNLWQALCRIDEFERRYGVEVSKVMAPPHGACSERALDQMAQLGFEAACISTGSLYHYNKQASWLRTLGMMPADIIAGLVVIPRFRISQTCQNSILMAALLDQPIIPVGHHHDLAEGLQLFADLAGFINPLGKVHWSDMKGICRAHYAQKLEGNILRIRMLTRRVEICVPEGVNQIVVERPSCHQSEFMPLAWKSLSDGSEWKYQLPDEPIPVLSGGKIEIASHPTAFPPYNAKNVKNVHLWPFVRRQLTEARDRLTPVLRRFQLFNEVDRN